MTLGCTPLLAFRAFSVACLLSFFAPNPSARQGNPTPHFSLSSGPLHTSRRHHSAQLCTPPSCHCTLVRSVRLAIPARSGRPWVQLPACLPACLSSTVLNAFTKLCLHRGFQCTVHSKAAKCTTKCAVCVGRYKTQQERLLRPASVIVEMVGTACIGAEAEDVSCSPHKHPLCAIQNWRRQGCGL